MLTMLDRLFIINYNVYIQMLLYKMILSFYKIMEIDHLYLNNHTGSTPP